MAQTKLCRIAEAIKNRKEIKNYNRYIGTPFFLDILLVLYNITDIDEKIRHFVP